MFHAILRILLLSINPMLFFSDFFLQQVTLLYLHCDHFIKNLSLSFDTNFTFSTCSDKNFQFIFHVNCIVPITHYFILYCNTLI